MAVLKIFLLVVAINGSVVLGQNATGKCLQPTGPNDEFSFVFRFKPEAGNTITEVGFYNSSMAPASTDPLINTPAQCVDTTATNGIYELGFSVDGDAASLPCGIRRTGNNYKLTFGIKGTTNRAYTMTCTTGAGSNLGNFPSLMNITNFETGNMLNTLVYRENPRSVCLRIVHADGNRVPSIFARLGELLKLQVLLDKEYSEGPDLWGSTFHIPFIQHNDAEIYLQVVTRELPQRIKVSGFLFGQQFTYYAEVYRDVETLINIPSVYLHPNSFIPTIWGTTPRAVKVEIPTPILCGEIAVKVISKQPSNVRSGTFMAIPDDALGTKYNCFTGSRGVNRGRCLIYAIQSSTIVTINFNSYDITDLTINGANATSTTTLVMGESQTLHMYCERDCHLITITSNKPIGVVTGHDDKKIETSDSTKGHYVSQLFPVSTYGDFFVLLPGSLLGTSVQYQIIPENPTATTNYVRNGSPTGSSYAAGAYIDNVVSAEEISFSRKTQLLMTSKDATPFTMPYPALHQWSVRHYFFVVPGETYRVVVVGSIGTVSKIEYRDPYAITDAGTTTTLGAITGFSTTNVTPLTTRPARYEYFTRTISAKPGQGPILIELKSGVRNSPFMFIVQPTISSTNNVQYMSIGTKLPTVNPCVTSPSVVTAFGTYTQSAPGDGVDNDCDGSVDEENNDGQDSDGDGKIDEDLAFNPIYPNLGIFVETLYASNNAQFSTTGTGVVLTLIENGCAARGTNSTIRVEPFSWNPNIGPMFDTYHLVETDPFGAFFIHEPTIYFRAKIKFCGGAELSTSRCNMSCVTTSGRKRRQADDVISVDASITITDAIKENDTVATPEGPCSMDQRYWIPPVLLLFTILIESMVTGVFLLIKMSYKKHM